MVSCPEQAVNNKGLERSKMLGKLFTNDLK
jgi:hypothetical protein